MSPAFCPSEMIRPQRKLTGISAILLPFTEAGEVDWTALQAHILRTAETGLMPAVNMDTGFLNLISACWKSRGRSCTARRFAPEPFRPINRALPGARMNTCGKWS